MIAKTLFNKIKNLLQPAKDNTTEATPESSPSVLAASDPVTQGRTAPTPAVARARPRRIHRSEHGLSRHHISRSALKVLYQLNEAGYEAYLVGGGVRDVLLGRVPKDFDVATNAHPEQIKRLFRNCRLIGRRFVLAHVYFGKEIIEVATFRAHHAKGKAGEGAAENGRILRDNVYGNIDDDALRRDFTVNALYYDISDYSVLDYANGMADLQAGVLRLIGDPELRYQEDPVRMLRAARFAAKLEMQVAPETAEPIYQLGDLLDCIPPARLYEEVQKLFLTGHALASFRELRNFDLFKHLFSMTDECLDDQQDLLLIEQSLINTDERITQGKPVAPAFLLATLLWAPLQRIISDFPEQELSDQERMILAAQKVVSEQAKQVAIPRRIAAVIQEIWVMQPRLTRRKDKRVWGLIENQRFRAGYDFLLLRASVGEPVQDSAEWWTEFYQSDDYGRQGMLDTARSKNPRRKPRRRRKKKPEDAGSDAAPDQPNQQTNAE